MIDEATAREWKERGRKACLQCATPLDAESAYSAMLSHYQLAMVEEMTTVIQVAMEFAWGWEAACQGRTRQEAENS